MHRPSTPIFELLRYKYQDMWLQDMKESERKFRESDTEKVCIHTTYACANLFKHTTYMILYCIKNKFTKYVCISHWIQHYIRTYVHMILCTYVCVCINSFYKCICYDRTCAYEEICASMWCTSLHLADSPHLVLLNYCTIKHRVRTYVCTHVYKYYVFLCC